MIFLKLIVLFIIAVNNCDCANILYVMPFTAKSHYIVMKSVALELARRGHNVTVIAGHKESNAPSNYRQVIIDNVEIWDVLGVERPNVFDMVNISPETFYTQLLSKGGVILTDIALKSAEVQAMLAEDLKFDLVISEQFFQEATNILAHKYQAPLVLVTTFGNCMKHNIANRNPLQLATVLAEYVSVNEPSSFWARLRNLYYIVYEYTYWRYIYLDEQEELVKIYFPDLPKPVPSLYEMQRNASLILINSHFTFDSPVAYRPISRTMFYLQNVYFSVERLKCCACIILFITLLWKTLAI